MSLFSSYISICDTGIRIKYCNIVKSHQPTGRILTTDLKLLITRPLLPHLRQRLRRGRRAMLPQLPNPPPPLNLPDHKVPRIGIIVRLRLALQHTAIEPLRSHHAAPARGVPRIRRSNVVVAPLLPSRTIVCTDGGGKHLVDGEEAVVVVARVVPAEAAVGVECRAEAGEPVGVVGGFGAGVGVECYIISN